MKARATHHCAKLDAMPLALFDLDNTLVDRAGCFRTAIEGMARDHGLDPDVVVPFVIEADADGLRGWDEWTAMTRERFELTDSIEALQAAHRVRYLAAFTPDPRVAGALDRLRSAGWRIAVVTNGPPTQSEKLTTAALDGLVDACAISDVVGARKPDPAIFAAAAEAAGASLEGAWMVGDSVEADIAGAVACGLDSIWIDRGRAWPVARFAPTVTVTHVVDAVDVLLGQGGHRS
jgi:putative hydrolase of the HAD superfamily